MSVFDPRTKAGAYGEQVKGPHKPTLDEMSPHAERGLPVSGKPVPPKPPVKTIEGLDERERKQHRRGRPARRAGQGRRRRAADSLPPVGLAIASGWWNAAKPARRPASINPWPD